MSNQADYQDYQDYPLLNKIYDKKYLEKKYKKFKEKFKFQLEIDNQSLEINNQSLGINGNNILINTSNEYLKYATLTDYFLQHLRIKCKSSSNSMFDYFKNNKKDWLPIYNKGIIKYDII